ncbi:MAG: HAD family hydrolase [Candidatus Paceibacterota bacterium]
MNGTKVVLFDVDGVLINLPHYFSKELQRQGYEDAQESLNAFYQGEDSRQCSEGKADAQICIMPYLEKFGWTGSAGDYFERQFDFERKYLDKDLVSLVAELRGGGVKCYLCTDQMANRAEFLLREMGFGDIFDGHFISCRIGFRKCHEEFWDQVAAELKKEFPELKLDEVVYFDDIQNNIDVASRFGIRAFLYNGIDQVKASVI